jgi:ParB family chromosome partitioning protein
LESPVKQQELGEKRWIDIDQIKPGRWQTRQSMDREKLEELAQNIRKVGGLVQAIVVRFDVKDGRYEIIAGERRWRASQIAGLHQIECDVKNLEDGQCLKFSISENIQRESLNPIEEALSFKRLYKELGLKQDEIADEIGKGRTFVAQRLRLLNLEEGIQEWIAEGRLDPGQGKAILIAPEGMRKGLAEQIMRHKWSVRHAEKKAGELVKLKEGITIEGDGVMPEVRQLQNELTEELCAPTRVDHQDSGAGKVVIDYSSLDELQGILDLIRRNKERF